MAYPLLERAYRSVTGRSPPHDRAADAVDRTLSFVDQAPADRPVFVWLHLMETHSPYVPPEPYRERYLEDDLSDGEIWRLNDRLHTDPDALSDREVGYISDLYDASLRYMDDEIGRLFEGLDDRGRFEDAAVAFTADHGEGFREHDHLTHCSEPYEEGVHVPLVFRHGDADLRDVDDAVTSTVDIAPTLLAFAFDDPEIPEKYHGTSLLPALSGDAAVPADRAVFSQDASEEGREINLDNRITGCRTREWKYITSVKSEVAEKLFYLPEDPTEQSNVASERPEICADLAARIERHYDQPAYTDYEIEGAVDTGHVSDRLKALGYLDE